MKRHNHPCHEVARHREKEVETLAKKIDGNILIVTALVFRTPEYVKAPNFPVYFIMTDMKLLH